MTQTAIVVGSSLAGLASAVALAEAGWKVTVLEQGDEPVSRPVGIVLTRNGRQALAALGLAGDVERAGVATVMGEIRSDAGLPLLQEPSAESGGAVAIHHDTLRRLLAERADDLGATVEYGTDAQQPDDLPQADLVIGADGIRSTVRGWLAPRVKPDYSGSTCWFGVCARDATTPETLISWVGRGLEAGIMPLDDDRAYWYIAKLARLGAAGDDPAGEAAEVSAAIDGPVTEHVLATDPANLRREDLWYLPTSLRRFAFVDDGTPTVLVGDAAHASVPSLGQGANQAFEDAATLFALLETDLDVAELCDRFNQERVGRAQQMQQRSLDMMRFLQSGTGVGGAVRNLALKSTPTLAAEIAMDWHASWWDPRRRR